MATWTAAYVNDLPDGAFAFIESGGEKDSEGKTTPRSLRHFPHHDASGSPDAAHVRNALARIPQSNVSAEGKASALAHIQAHAKAMDIGDYDSLPEGYETRAFADFELREAVPSADPSAQGVIQTGAMPRIVGHAARFGAVSDDLGGFREKISREAFRKTLQEGNCRALWNHDSRLLLGTVKNQTLSLREDKDGLACDIQMPNTSYARDLAEIIRRGDLTGMSFGFRVIRDDWAMEANENVRTLKEVELLDVSPVTYPAYQQTDVAMRSLRKFLSDHTAPAQAGHSVSAAGLGIAGAVAETSRRRRRLMEQSII